MISGVCQWLLGGDINGRHGSNNFQRSWLLFIHHWYLLREAVELPAFSFRPSLRRSTSAQWLPWESNHKRLKLKVAELLFCLAKRMDGVCWIVSCFLKRCPFSVCVFFSIIMIDQKWEPNVKAFSIIPIDPDTLYSCKMCKFYLIIYVYIYIYIHMYTWNQILIEDYIGACMHLPRCIQSFHG